LAATPDAPGRAELATTSRTRQSTSTLATFGATERNATNGDGAPW